MKDSFIRCRERPASGRSATPRIPNSRLPGFTSLTARVEDLLPIERVEPGALWFKGDIGPLKVPKEASVLAQAGWSVNVMLAQKRGVWHLLEVGNVYPG